MDLIFSYLSRFFYVLKFSDLIDIAIYKAQIYAHTNPSKAIEELEKAREYAVMFDNIFMHTPNIPNPLSWDCPNPPC